MDNVLDYVRKYVKAHRGGLNRVAAESGVARGTVRRIVYDLTANPMYRNFEKLRQWAERQNANIREG